MAVTGLSLVCWTKRGEDLTVLTTCLNGTWRATDQVGLAARAGRADYDDSSWLAVTVPGHWQDTPGLAPDCPRLLYRRTFRVDQPPVPGEVWRLRFDGVFRSALVWLNGKLAGEQRGYFLPGHHEVTKLVQPGENVLVVEVACPPEARPDARTDVLGIFGPWPDRDPRFQPGGIWRDVWLDVFPAGLVPEQLLVRATPRVLPLPPEQPPHTGYVPEGEAIPAEVWGRLEYWSRREYPALPWTAGVEPVTFAGAAHTTTGEVAVRRGQGRLEFRLHLPDARLWWTWDHGRPDLYRLTLTLHPPGAAPEVLTRTFGIRTVSLENWIFRLNGRRVFLRGANYAPPEIRLAACTRDDYRRDLELARQANMNILRAVAHVDRPELYEEADRLGLLIWQDFPLYGLHAKSVLPEARRQMAGMVAALGHHPSIGLWCAHSHPANPPDPEPRSFLAAQAEALATAAVPNWNRDGLAPELAALARRLDPTRPAVAASGEWGFLYGGSDTRHWWGWYHGEIGDLDTLLRLRPALARLVSGYGAQAFPDLAGTRRLTGGQAWPDLDWDGLAARHLLQPRVLLKRVPRSAVPDLQGYIAATQEYQRLLLKRCTEALRMRRYVPCGGALLYLLAECSPGIGFGILDFWRTPRAAYAEIQRAFSPAYVLCPWPEPAYRAGRDLVLPVFLVNDWHRRLSAAWSWRVEREGQELGAGPAAAVELAPDSLQAASLRWPVPATAAPGRAELVLRLAVGGQAPLENRYPITLVAPGD